jgi:hypothetical protein
MALYARCPKCGADSAGADTCPACGLIYAKYLKSALGGTPARAAASPAVREEGAVSQLLFAVPEEVGAAALYARAALLAILSGYGVYLASLDIPEAEIWGTLMHYPIVPIHEFGHVLFRPFGEFLHNLGGTLFQVGLPLIFGGILLVKNRDPFAAAVTLWWSAVALIDAAPYVYDAWKPQHVLLSGRTGDTGSHDFIDVLGDLGVLHLAQPIGYGVRAFGIVMLAAAIGWAAYILWLQFRAKSD